MNVNFFGLGAFDSIMYGCTVQSRLMIGLDRLLHLPFKCQAQKISPMQSFKQSKLTEYVFCLQVWRLENEFYNFALEHFHFLRKKTLIEAENSGRLVDRGQKFAYEKIKPKKSQVVVPAEEPYVVLEICQVK